MTWQLIETDNATLIEKVKTVLQSDYGQLFFNVTQGTKKAYLLRCEKIDETNIELIASLFYSLGYYVHLFRD